MPTHADIQTQCNPVQLHALCCARSSQRINAPPRIPQATPIPFTTLLEFAAPVAEAPRTFIVELAALSAALRFSKLSNVDLGAIAEEVIKKPC